MMWGSLTVVAGVIVSVPSPPDAVANGEVMLMVVPVYPNSVLQWMTGGGAVDPESVHRP